MVPQQLSRAITSEGLALTLPCLPNNVIPRAKPLYRYAGRPEPSLPSSAFIIVPTRFAERRFPRYHLDAATSAPGPLCYTQAGRQFFKDKEYILNLPINCPKKKCRLRYMHAIANAANHKVDGSIVVPMVTAVTLSSSPASGNTYGAGETIDLQAGFLVAVTVTGTPQLALTIGTGTGQAGHTSGSGTQTLTFRYTVRATDADSDGFSIGANALTLNGGTLQSGRGPNAALGLRTRALANQANHKVNGAATMPTVMSVAISSRPANGDRYGAGESITFLGRALKGTSTACIHRRGTAMKEVAPDHIAPAEVRYTQEAIDSTDQAGLIEHAQASSDALRKDEMVSESWQRSLVVPDGERPYSVREDAKHFAKVSVFAQWLHVRFIEANVRALEYIDRLPKGGECRERKTREIRRRGKGWWA